MENHLVSIIVPAYNAEKTIKKTVESIINQTYTKFELIIIDDGSRDSTSALVESYYDKRIKLIKKENGGVSSARNLGIKNAVGEYIAFCDADDIWKSNKLELQMNVLCSDKSIDFIGCNRNGERTKIFFNSYNIVKKIKFSDLLVKTFPQTSTVVIRKNIFDEVGMYDEKQKYAEDGNLWLRICYKKNCYMMPDSLVVTGNGKPNFGSSGLSANLKEMSAGVIKNIREIYNLHYIGLSKMVCLIVFEKIKYLRRVLICKFRK